MPDPLARIHQKGKHMSKQNWVGVDLDGLTKIIDKRGKAFAIFELLSNAWDTKATEVNISLQPVPGRGLAILTIEDNDPEGFHDLAHAFTLFAPSIKKDDPEKRGRFNLGEKLVLALCEQATIQSTKGTIHFNQNGTRTSSKSCRSAGSAIMMRIRMTRDELAEVEKAMRTVLPRHQNVRTTFNGEVLQPRVPLKVFRAPLPTVKADEEGNLTRTVRQTEVRIFAPLPDEVATIFEMGIPVVATGDRFHVDVCQKVPLSMERDNVTPSYLSELRALVLNAVSDRLDHEAASESWVTAALESDKVEVDAVINAVRQRYGEKAAIFDPNDLEANHNLASAGYTIVSGGSLPKAAWANIRRAGALKSSGAIRPTPKPFSDDPNAEPAERLPPEAWTTEMKTVKDFIESLGPKLLGMPVHVTFFKEFDAAAGPSVACFGPSGDFGFSMKRLGKRWFSEVDLLSLLDLIIHEFGHVEGATHLEERYHKKVTRLGAKLGLIANADHDLFAAFAGRM